MVRLTLDTSGFDAEQRKMLAAAKNPRPPLKAFAVEFATDVLNTWETMSFSSLWNAPKNFRNAAMWKPVKPQYVRKDGTRVPPWGGVARVSAGWKTVGANVEYYTDANGRLRVRKKRALQRKLKSVSGAVKPKTRPSGAPVRALDLVGKDTQEMAREFTGPPSFTADGRTVILSTNRKYAEAQNKLRPFNRFSRKDNERLVYWVRNWLDGLIQARNQRNGR